MFGLGDALASSVISAATSALGLGPRLAPSLAFGSESGLAFGFGPGLAFGFGPGLTVGFGPGLPATSALGLGPRLAPDLGFGPGLPTTLILGLALALVLSASGVVVMRISALRGVVMLLAVLVWSRAGEHFPVFCFVIVSRVASASAIHDLRYVARGIQNARTNKPLFFMGTALVSPM